MVERNNLDPRDKRHCPLHRERNFNAVNRKLNKYLAHSNWYMETDLGDKYRNGWKCWIKRKGPKRGRYANKEGIRARSKNISTVMFVPKTVGGKLSNMLQTVEDNLPVGWRTKLVEKPGSPLFTKFTNKFSNVVGMPEGT